MDGSFRVESGRTEGLAFLIIFLDNVDDLKTKVTGELARNEQRRWRDRDDLRVDVEVPA